MPPVLLADVAGFWHGPWDKVKQAEWLDQFYRIALSKTCIDGVMYSNFTDVADGAVPESGLMTAGLEPKESYLAIEEVPRPYLWPVTDYRYEQDSIVCVCYCLLPGCCFWPVLYDWQRQCEKRDGICRIGKQDKSE